MTSGPLFLRLGVPSGMEDLLEGLAREVLRHQPRDIYRFAAIHFQGLLLQREALVKSNNEAQNAALSPSSTHNEGLNNGTELLTADKQQPVTQIVTTKSPAPQPPTSQASDSGAASATSSPAVSPSRSPGPQTVRAKLTTTANKHPSPVFQQAIKTAFNAESLLSDHASKSPELRKTTSPTSPVEKKSENSNQNKSTPSPGSRSTVTSPLENAEVRKSGSVSVTPVNKETDSSDGVKSPESNIDKITASEPNENASSPVVLARSSEPSSPRQKEEGDGAEGKESSELDGIKSPSDENKEDLGERCVSGASQNEIQANSSENIDNKSTEPSRAASKNEVTSPEPETQVKNETPVESPLAPTTSSAETQSEQKGVKQGGKENAEQSGSTLSKRASELGSEDFKPQTPDIIGQSPDQSTYDDVSAAVLIDDEADQPAVPSPKVEISDVTDEKDETSETEEISEVNITQVVSESPKPAAQEEEKSDLNEKEIIASEVEEEPKSEGGQIISPVKNENEIIEKVEIEQSDKIDTPVPEKSLTPENNEEKEGEGESSKNLVTPTPPPSPVRSGNATGSQAGSRMSQTEEIDQASGEMEKIKNSVIELAKLEGEEKAETPDLEGENKSGGEATPEPALKETEHTEETEPREEVSNTEKSQLEDNNATANQVETTEKNETSEAVIEDSNETIMENTSETVEIISEENADTEKEIVDDKNEISEAEKLAENMSVALNFPSETGELIGNIVETQSHQNEDANVSRHADGEKNNEFAPTAPLETPDKDVLPARACSNLSVLCECTSAPVDASAAEASVVEASAVEASSAESAVEASAVETSAVEASAAETSAVETSAVEASETETAVTLERDPEKINTEGKSETPISEEKITTEGDNVDTINTENTGDTTQNEVDLIDIKSDNVEAIEEISETKVAQAVETAVEQLYDEIASTTPDEEDLIGLLSMETPQETGEILAVQSSTEQETVMQILQEDATPSDSQSSLVGNEGLGAVTGVVIRYSISENNENDPDNEQQLVNEETDKNEDEASCIVEQEIAETIIAAVRDSEDTPTETASISGGDAAQPSVSEPAEVTSAQTSSSKDAASLELDDVDKEAIVVEPIDLSNFDESDKVECVVLSEDNTNDKAGEITLESPQFPIEDISIDTAVQQEMVESPSSGEQVPKESVPDKIILEERKIPEKLSIAERELEEAATMIQSSFRGYHVRKLSDVRQEAQNTVVPEVVARVLDDSEEEAETSDNKDGEVADTSRALSDLDETKEKMDTEQLVETIETDTQNKVKFIENQVSETEIKNTASDDILENREQISEAVNEIIDEAVAVTESVQEMVTSEVPVEIVSSGLVAGSAAAAAIVTSTDSTSPPQVWHAVPAQVFEDEEALLTETEAKLEASRARNEEPSALVELLQNSTLIAATPLAYVDPIPVEISQENNSTFDLIQNSTLIATTPLAFTDSGTPPSVSHHLQNTYSSSGECADVSASMTEPISWNGESRTVDQESGEIVTADEDDGVWATLEKELGETQELNDAATKIQAGFRGHKTRQSLLQREDAVQIISSSGASGDMANTTPFSGVRHTGEFHDSLPLLPLSGERPSELEDATNFTRLHNSQQQDDEDMTSSGSESFLDRAATKIQSTFRGFKTRNELKKEKSPVRNSDIDAATKIQAGYRGYKVRKDMKEDKLPRIQSAPQIFVHNSIEDDSATKIQAGVRGYLTRQRLKKERSPQPSPPPSPEVQDAVVKIQAGFRGYKARQEVKSMKEGKNT